MGVRDHHRAAEPAALPQPVRAGELAVSVEGIHRSGQGCSDAIPAERQHGGDSGARSDRRIAGVLDHRDHADLDSGHVGDGIEWSGGSVEGDPEIARSHAGTLRFA